MAGKTEYKNTWQREKVDRINLVIPKGGKAKIQACANSQSESVNAFIIASIEERMERLGVGKRIAPLTDDQIVARMRGKLRRFGQKIHKLKARSYTGDIIYQVLDADEDPKEHEDDEYGLFNLDGLISYVEELEEKEAERKYLLNEGKERN